jgi:hypothetical protein
MMIGPLCYADERHEEDVARVALLCSLINIGAVCMRLSMIGEKGRSGSSAARKS